MTPSRCINRGRSRAKLVLDADEAMGGDVQYFASGMLSAIGERLAERLGDLGAAEIIAQFSFDMDLKVPAHEICSISGRSKIP